MPTYDYECSKGCHFELQQSIKDEPISRCTRAICPQGLGGVKVRRLISASHFILKGGGWYSDGYSSAKGGKDASEGSSDSSSSTSSKESKTTSSGDSSD